MRVKFTVLFGNAILATLMSGRKYDVMPTHWIRDWVGNKVSLDDVENRKFFTPVGPGLRPLDRLSCSQLLH
jgi:hypothetical protein